MSDEDTPEPEVTWTASATGTFRYAVIYDAAPTIGEETTVTLVDADGNVETRTFIAEEVDDDATT